MESALVEYTQKTLHVVVDRRLVLWYHLEAFVFSHSRCDVRAHMIVTGGAEGADALWSKLTKREVRIVSFYGHVVSKECRGTILRLSQKELDSKQREFIKVAGLLNRSVPGGAYVLNLLKRNLFIVEDVDAVFAVGYLNRGVVDGGTAWGIEYSNWRFPHRPIYFFDQMSNEWYMRVEKEWERTNPARISEFKKVACIGTRDLKENGIAAMMEVATPE